MPPSATPATRNSIGTVTCSAAYLRRKPTPTNSTSTPTRARLLPPVIQRHSRDGSRGGNGGASSPLGSAYAGVRGSSGNTSVGGRSLSSTGTGRSAAVDATGTSIGVGGNTDCAI